jgi:hypothetical protein
MSEEDNTQNTSEIEEKTKARDTARHGSHFTQPPESKYEEEEQEESKE